MDYLPAKIRIGIVDDHSLFKAAIKKILSSNHDLEFVIDADNGLDLLEQLQKGQPDVLLLDLIMSVMDGLTVLPIIKKKYPSIKVIILSLYDDKELMTELLRSGASSYISKNDSPTYMYSRISACYTKS
jgi:DNA-binding NarL/FixJ family response regulator